MLNYLIKNYSTYIHTCIDMCLIEKLISYKHANMLAYLRKFDPY